MAGPDHRSARDTSAGSVSPSSPRDSPAQPSPGALLSHAELSPRLWAHPASRCPGMEVASVDGDEHLACPQVEGAAVRAQQQGCVVGHARHLEPLHNPLGRVWGGRVMGVSPAQPVRVSTDVRGPAPQVAPGPSAGHQCPGIAAWPCRCTDLPGLDLALPMWPDTCGTTPQGAVHHHDSAEGSTTAASTSCHLVQPQVGARTPQPPCPAPGTAARSALTRPHTALGSAQPRGGPEPTISWQGDGYWDQPPTLVHGRLWWLPVPDTGAEAARAS